MARSEIDGDQIQDETITGLDILNDSIRIEDLENYSFTTLEDVETISLKDSDFIVFDFDSNKFVNKESCEINYFSKISFTEIEPLHIPDGKVLILRCPSFESDIILDGELYII
jgi:hypothetical protein